MYAKAKRPMRFLHHLGKAVAKKCGEIFSVFALAVPGNHEVFDYDDEDEAFDCWRKDRSPPSYTASSTYPSRCKSRSRL